MTLNLCVIYCNLNIVAYSTVSLCSGLRLFVVEVVHQLVSVVHEFSSSTKHLEQLSAYSVYWLTWFKLNSDSCVVLDFLDHFSIPANNDSYSKPWDWNLKLQINK